MGIFCEINVARHDDEYLPGDMVTGFINYAVDEKRVFDKITVSLKGIGRLRIISKLRKDYPEYHNKETYVDIDDVILENEEELSTGEYKAKFSFKLPESIPPSFKYYNNKGDYIIKCKFIYYIRIKFESPGLLQFPKRFKKEIAVGTQFTPSLPTQPVIYGKEKKIVKIFSGNNKVYIKVNIENSVINTGKVVRFSYELINDTKLELKGVKVKLVEVHAFKAKAGIKGGETQNMNFQIIVPFDKKTMQHSKIATRGYIVKIKVFLPLFRQNFVLDIPVEIGNNTEAKAEDFDAPPSYWEVMGESKTKLFSDDDGYTTDEDK
ncbi:uncharacterized protein ACR2FA_002123 [Aphomia sociella]